MFSSVSIPPEYIQVLPSAVAGYVTFGASLALSTLTQLKLGISTGSRPPIPSIAGILSVGLASLASHHVAIQSYINLSGDNRERIDRENKMRKFTFNAIKDDSISFEYMNVPKHAIRVCTVGLVTFKLLGGRFWSISPSSYTSLGSFARFSIPASENYATQFQRQQIERIGSLWGCHTCGNRAVFQLKGNVKFHADHIPPISVAKQMNSRLWRRLFHIQVKHRFYPQCVKCSNEQGGILRQATSALQTNPKINLWKAGAGSLACFHGNRFRLFHFAGAVIAAITVYDEGGVDKFKYLQNQIIGNLQKVLVIINTR